MTRVTVLALVCTVGAALVAVLDHALAQQSQPAEKFPSKFVDEKGNITFPDDYRARWSHLGSWVVQEGKAEEYGFHDVYAEPDAVVEYRKTGKWPDGAMIVKESRAMRGGKLTTGDARWAGDVVVWFVMVKDSKKSFPDNPNWGRGWGWGLYSIDDPKKNISTNYKKDCINCHIPAQDTDWIFVEGYPLLLEKDGPFKKYPAGTYGGEPKK